MIFSHALEITSSAALADSPLLLILLVGVSKVLSLDLSLSGADECSSSSIISSFLPPPIPTPPLAAPLRANKAVGPEPDDVKAITVSKS
jgi:hypothetical protein